ncbi:MAG: endolytic transglycosylase MltG [Caldisericia bacterium]|nr:endolytic transglycosylase MltG [Caldisericia bacterium]
MKSLKIFLFVIFALVLIFAACFYTYDEMLPPKNFKPTKVTIPCDSTVQQIAEIAYKNNLIKNKTLFILLSKYYKIDKNLKSGIYTFDKKMDLREVLLKFTEGGIPPYVKVTIPEGYTLKEIEEIFIRNRICSKEDFEREVSNIDKYKNYIFDDADSLEGFLYPDTYFFEREKTEKDIKMMLENFKSKCNPLFNEYKGDLSNYEVLILASIVEKEAQVDEERKIIASVFINRLKLGMKLQADPTLKYVLPDAGYTLTSKELEIDSPYNTYKYRGLPPTPICNPSVKSIEAVIHPAKTDFLYFVAKGDGTHLFARTYEEHLKNIRKVMP